METKAKSHPRKAIAVAALILGLVSGCLYVGYALGYIHWPFFQNSTDVATGGNTNADANASSTTSHGVTLFKYIEITGGCDTGFAGGCVNMRSGPGKSYPVVSRLRNGVVLKVADTVVQDDRTWYRIAIDDGIHYPERVGEGWYVGTDGATVFYDDGARDMKPGKTATSTKRIVVDVSEQMLYAYDGDRLFVKEQVSTGLEFTPTSIGMFRIFRMTPSRYMQGPLPGSANDSYFDLPGVPWDMYFTEDGQVIHGAYWHVGFGERWSHGCVNLPPEKAKKLYMWADIGTKVLVQE